MKVEFSPAAAADLGDIASFIAQDSPVRAATFVGKLEKKCAALGTSPDIGTARPELGDGIRVLPCGRYLIFHRRADKALRIERILTALATSATTISTRTIRRCGSKRGTFSPPATACPPADPRPRPRSR